MRLATFVHISDIHFSNDAQDAEVAKIYAVSPKLDGFLGHSYKSLTLLEPLFDDLKTREQARLVVSGDLTRVGNSLEFEAAENYLGAELTPPLGNYVGLGETDWLELTTPGNHDRYPGVPFLWGGPTRDFFRLFPGMPKVVDIPLPSSRGHSLKFIMVDTDADVAGWSVKRGAARGSFTTQLRALRGMLGPPGALEIRVLCLHHSRAHRGKFLGIDSATRTELDDFIVSHGIRVLLSGHIHEPPLVETSLATGPSGSRRYLEARCGTTTQRNLFHLPYYWRNLPGFKVGKPHWSNSLLVHRLLEENDEILWDVELFLETPSEFASPLPQPPSIMVDPRMRVWP
jgi:3',5'-cyclic AMP phosphodiesterase CpdA